MGEGGVEKRRIEPYGIDVVESSLGAYTGEFPTVIVAFLGGIAGGMLAAIGEDIWNTIKKWLKDRFHELEQDRKAKEKTREGRNRVFAVYMVSQVGKIPVLYYSIPNESRLNLDFDRDALVQAESEIGILMRAGKLTTGNFLGVNLPHVGKGLYLRIFKAIPSESSIIEEITADRVRVEGYSHALVGLYFDDLDMRLKARKHYELAIGGIPEDAKLHINLGITHARDGDLSAATKYWEEAARLDGKWDIFHYNVACFHASQGNVQAAARELQLAVDKGFRDVGGLLHDAEFSQIISYPDIEAIVNDLKSRLRG